MLLIYIPMSNQILHFDMNYFVTDSLHTTEIITTLSSEPLINKSIQSKKTKQKKETDHDKVFLFAEELWVFSLSDRV